MKEKCRKIDWLCFSILLVIYTGILFVLFYRQATGSEWMYHSDIKAYMLEMQGLDSGYEFPYPLFFKLSAFFNLFLKPEWAVAVAVTLLNSLSVICLKHYMNSLLWTEAVCKEKKDNPWMGVFLSILTLSLFFVSMVFSPKGVFLPGIYRKYTGVFSPNPFHNATYLATRPFSIVCFFVFVRILEQYENKINKKDCVLFTLFLFLTTITKPSFTFVLVATAGLIMGYRLCRNRFRTWRPTLQLGLCFLPTFGALLYQFWGVFVPKEIGEETGIGFGIATAWKIHCGNIPLAIGLGLGFPILILLLHGREWKKDACYRFVWQFTGMSLFMILFLYEKGFRLPDMNFSWGYMHGMFFAFVVSLMVLVRSTMARQERKIVCVIEWAAYGLHLVCGIIYFLYIYGGGLYYYDV